MPTPTKPLPFDASILKGISEKTLAIHHDKLYAGYVAKKDAIAAELQKFSSGEKSAEGTNPTMSELRSLKDGETFAVNGVYLHEAYFDNLGGKGEANGSLAKALEEKYGSVGKFIDYFKACGMASRGWTVLAWDTREQKLRVFNGDAHNQGGVWGAIPILVLDVYEHAYFMDYGSDRAAYIADFIANLNWEHLNKVYESVKTYSWK